MMSLTGILILGGVFVFLFPGSFMDHGISGISDMDKRIGTQVLIKRGQYHVGNDREPDNQPCRMMDFEEFFIDTHPVVNIQYARFLMESHYHPEGNFNIQKARQSPTLPATGVSYRDAGAYARYYHKRLPTEWEWEIAARSLKKDIVYATESLPTLETGNFFRYKQKNGLTTVFTYPPNKLGIYDMAGNVFEWTSSLYPKEKFSGKYYRKYQIQVLRGGSWTNIPHDVRVSTRTPFPASRYLDWIGFRCVSKTR